MKLLFLSLITLTIGSAFAKDCRTAIVDASISLNEPLSPESFSTNSFADFNLTAAEFNALPSTEQVDIYNRIKPLSVMVEEMVGKVNRTINYLNNYPYIRLFRSELIDEFRAHRTELRACN
tara:strand:+ start:11453 stop:11815 length:363 start_codon:yes stop_codon:yes gene_type:complete